MNEDDQQDLVTLEWRKHMEGKMSNMESSLSSFQNEVRAGFQNIGERLSSQGKPNWQIWIGVMTLLITVMAGFIYFMKTEISNQVLPVSLKATASESDRHTLNDKVSKLDSISIKTERDLSNIQSALEVQLIEIETQFRSTGQMQNMRHANNQQLFGLLWKKVYGEDLPMSSYYPDMSRNKAVDK